MKNEAIEQAWRERLAALSRADYLRDESIPLRYEALRLNTIGQKKKEAAEKTLDLRSSKTAHGNKIKYSAMKLLAEGKCMIESSKETEAKANRMWCEADLIEENATYWFVSCIADIHGSSTRILHLSSKKCVLENGETYECSQRPTNRRTIDHEPKTLAALQASPESRKGIHSASQQLETPSADLAKESETRP